MRATADLSTGQVVHGLYAQRQAEFEAELRSAQDGESER